MRPHPKRARTDATSPRAWATSDRSGFIGNHENLRRQFQWRGKSLMDTKVLVYADELDIPQRQLGVILLPPDPPSILNARPEQYLIDEQTYRTTEDGVRRVLMDGTYRVLSNLQVTDE